MGHVLFLRKGSVHTEPGKRSIIVQASDTQGYLNAIINTNGVLTVGGYTITGANTEIEVNRNVAITYKLTAGLSIARTMKVNESAIGSVGSAGDYLSTTVTVSNGDTVKIEFSA